MRKNKISKLGISGDDEEQDENEQVMLPFNNLGGFAESRTPNLQLDNPSEDRGGNSNTKKKQTAGLPWLFNLAGPPGKQLGQLYMSIGFNVR